MLGIGSDLIAIAAGTIDLCAETEAQLRAMVRLQEQLRRTMNGEDVGGTDLIAVLNRELQTMLANNANIRDILEQLEAETELRAASA